MECAGGVVGRLLGVAIIYRRIATAVSRLSGWRQSTVGSGRALCAGRWLSGAARDGRGHYWRRTVQPRYRGAEGPCGADYGYYPATVTAAQPTSPAVRLATSAADDGGAAAAGGPALAVSVCRAGLSGGIAAGAAA